MTARDWAIWLVCKAIVVLFGTVAVAAIFCGVVALTVFAVAHYLNQAGNLAKNLGMMRAWVRAGRPAIHHTTSRTWREVETGKDYTEVASGPLRQPARPVPADGAKIIIVRDKNGFSIAIADQDIQDGYWRITKTLAVARATVS